MNLQRMFIFILLSLIYSPLHAQWETQGVYVKKVDQFDAGGLIITRVIYETSTSSVLPSFTCAPNTTPIPGHPNRYQAAYWANTINGMHQTFMGQLLSAQAQELKIDIYFDPSGCDQNAARGYLGLGRKMHGISVNSD